jgi:hypothetical protein
MQLKALVFLAVAVLAMGGGYVGLMVWKGGAEERVAAAEAEAEQLANAKKQYAELLEVNQQLQDTDNARVAAIGYELEWADLIQAMVDSRPAGSRVAVITGSGMSAGMELQASTNVLARPAVGRIMVGIRVTTLDEVAEWITTLDGTPGLEMATYSVIESPEKENPGLYYDVTCSAEVNLLGLTGEVLPPEFTEWRDKTKAEIVAGTFGVEGGDE